MVRTWAWAHTAARKARDTRELGPVTWASPGELTRRPLTPPPGKFSCSEPQSKTKGRGEEGAAVPSNHRRRPSPSRALPRLLARSSRLAAHQGPSSPWSLVSPRPPVTGVGETAEGQPGMGKPDGSIPPPSSSIPPSGCPRPGCPPQGPEEAAGPARPGSPRGKGCLCLKVTTRARCPGRAWCLQFPGRGGGDEGPPRTSGSDRRRSPPHPRNGPLRDEPQLGVGEGVTSLHCRGLGVKSTPFIV